MSQPNSFTYFCLMDPSVRLRQSTTYTLWLQSTQSRQQHQSQRHDFRYSVKTRSSAGVKNSSWNCRWGPQNQRQIQLASVQRELGNINIHHLSIHAYRQKLKEKETRGSSALTVTWSPETVHWLVSLVFAPLILNLAIISIISWFF